MSNVTVVEINEGTKISWAQNAAKFTFGDDELMVNAEKYQRDWPVHLDICGDSDGNLVIGTGAGRYYVAQLDIPATQYAQPEEAAALAEGDAEMDGQQSAAAEPLPLEMSDVTLTLWAVDGLRI